MSLLNDGKLAKTIAAALANVMSQVQVKRTTSVYDPTTSSVTSTTVTYQARGMVDSFSTAEIQAGIVQAGDRRVTLLADGLSITPMPSTDKVMIDGDDLTIISASTDPAKATWTFRCR